MPLWPPRLGSMLEPSPSTLTHARTHIYTHMRVHTHMHTQAHMCTHAHTCTHTCVRTHIHTRAHTNARAHMCTHKHTHTHTHQSPVSFLPPSYWAGTTPGIPPDVLHRQSSRSCNTLWTLAGSPRWMYLFVRLVCGWVAWSFHSSLVLTTWLTLPPITAYRHLRLHNVLE